MYRNAEITDATISPLVRDLRRDLRRLARTSASPPSPEAIRPDSGDHRALAQVHGNAAKCLEAGKSEKEGHDLLAKECKGVGIGKFCGMRHRP